MKKLYFKDFKPWFQKIIKTLKESIMNKWAMTNINDKQCSTITYIGILIISITLCLYLNPLGTSVNTTQFWWNYII
jgi:hypothetical protein